jgi:hypothetical protein
MDNYLLPEYWNTLSPEGNNFYVALAKKYIEKKGTEAPKILITKCIQENVDFVNSDAELDAEASAKETQSVLMDFLTALFSDQGVTEDEVTDIWQDIFWNNISH